MPLVRSVTLLALLAGAAPRPVAAQGPDSALHAARAALAAGNGWRATRLLVPLLADRRHRTPGIELLAARAAAGWGGWAQVRTLLSGRPWLDSLEQGAGRELLARAALGLDDDTAAVTQAREALAHAATPADSGARLVLLARALDRTGSVAAAGSTYVAAARLIPLAGEWLRLRAAVTDATGPWTGPDTTLPDSLVRAHAPEAVAAGLERRKLYAAARQAYLALGDTLDAVRMAVAVAPDTSARRAAFTLLAGPLPNPQTIQALGFIDDAFAPLTPDEQLIAARAAARALQSARAAAGFEVALAAGKGNGEDTLRYAVALVRSGRATQGVTLLATLAGDTALAPRALLEAGRAYRRLADEGKAREAWGEAVRRFPTDTAVASSALFLLADQAVDSGRDGLALAEWDTLALRYPGTRLAIAARFQSAIVRFARHDFRRAGSAFDSLAAPETGGAEANAAAYWAGRAWSEAGQATAAADRWRALLTRAPDSYYADLARRRLGSSPPPIPLARALPDPAWIAEASARIQTLRGVGLDQEAGWEEDRLGAFTGGTDTMLAAAAALSGAGAAPAAQRMARLALTRPDVDSMRALLLLYPLEAGDVLDREARREGIDPAFAAALIRQESGFDPEAVSAAGARGIMQVMPAVGAGLARRLRFPLWDPVLLFQPDVNIELGMAELKRLALRFGDPVRVLAAYNAGATRPPLWARRAGADDPELFIERIPFPETRDYIRTVLRNREMYRRLYGW